MFKVVSAMIIVSLTVALLTKCHGHPDGPHFKNCESEIAKECRPAETRRSLDINACSDIPEVRARLSEDKPCL